MSKGYLTAFALVFILLTLLIAASGVPVAQARIYECGQWARWKAQNEQGGSDIAFDIRSCGTTDGRFGIQVGNPNDKDIKLHVAACRFNWKRGWTSWQSGFYHQNFKAGATWFQWTFSDQDLYAYADKRDMVPPSFECRDVTAEYKQPTTERRDSDRLPKSDDGGECRRKLNNRIKECHETFDENGSDFDQQALRSCIDRAKRYWNCPN